MAPKTEKSPGATALTEQMCLTITTIYSEKFNGINNKQRAMDTAHYLHRRD